MRKFISALLLSGAAATVNAQQVRPASAEKIYHEMAQMQHLVNVLYVAAHPDDENTRLLAWLVNDQNIRTAYLSLTRGDGGQNILGSETGEALGLIRTHELMEARKLDGAEQFFSRAIDFGFSKTKEETFKHWPEYLLTYDAVWVMRKFRPDVVICRFPPDTMAGHGQHAASAVIAARAFKMAGDKMQYTEQLKYYPQWQPKRLLQNTYRFGSRNTTSESQFKVPVGQYMPLFGMGSGELAGLSRSIHKSQGAGTPSTPGVQTEYFKLIDGDTLTNSLFDGIDITWGRVGRPDIGTDLQSIADKFDFKRPESSLPALFAVRKKIAEVKDDYWRTQKLKEIDQTILDCTGLMAEVYTKQPQTVAGSAPLFTMHIIARSHMPLVINGLEWDYGDSIMNLRIPYDTLLTFERNVSIRSGTPLTQPYWLAQAHPEKDMFSIPNDTLLGLPETPNDLNATLKLSIGGVNYTLPVPLSYKKTDPIKGDVVEPLRVVPGSTVSFNNSLIIANSDGSLQADLHIHAYQPIMDAMLNIFGTWKYKKTAADSTKSKTGATKPDSKIVPGDIDTEHMDMSITGINLASSGDTVITVHFDPKAVKGLAMDDFYLDASVRSPHMTMNDIDLHFTGFNPSLHLIQYNHLPTLQYFTKASTKVIRSDWKCTAKRIGYIEGAGDFIPTFLRLAGLEVDVLKETDLTSAAKLKKYDAIITGIRAANVEKRMAYWLPVLFEYAQNGGTLVMQYNTTQDLATTKLGPYPFTITADRVTEEDAKVTFVDPQSRLLNYPNKITDNDFTGWVQERGLYFASKWDDRYKPLFSMHDEGEQPLLGSTLYAKVGKGNYIYTCLSFNRQLPAGNIGAIHLLMNMLSVGK